jgi:Holliday junction resolvase RusA-like endonuclease
MRKLHINGTPVTKGRAIPIVVNGRTRMVADSKTKTYERHVGKAWQDADLPKHTGPVEVDILVFPDHVEVAVTPLDDTGVSPLQGDVDNYAKSILDGLNNIAWEDDIQVYVLNVVKVAYEQ